MQKAALCGLGQTAPNPVLSTMKYFEAEYAAHIDEKRCPAGKCKKLVTYSIDPAKCIGCTLCARKCPASTMAACANRPLEIGDHGHVRGRENLPRNGAKVAGLPTRPERYLRRGFRLLVNYATKSQFAEVRERTKP